MSHDKPFNPFEPAHAEGKTIVPPEESLDAMMSTPPPPAKDVGSKQSTFLPGPSGKFIVASHVDPQWETLLNAAINGWDAARANAVGELFERWQQAEVAATHNELDKRNLELLQSALAEDRAKHRAERAEWDRVCDQLRARSADLAARAVNAEAERDQAMESLAPNERELLSAREALQRAEEARGELEREAERLRVVQGALEQALADKRQALQVAVNGNMELTQRVADLRQELNESDQAMRGAAHRASRAEAELGKRGGPQGVRWRNAIAAGLWSQARTELVDVTRAASAREALAVKPLLLELSALANQWATRAAGLAEHTVMAMAIRPSPLSAEQVSQLAQDIADNKVVFTPIQPEQPLPKHSDVELPPIVMDERGNPKAVIAQPPPVQVVEGGGAQPATENPFAAAGVKGKPVPSAVSVGPNQILVDDEQLDDEAIREWSFRQRGEGVEPWPNHCRPAFGRKVEARVVRAVRIEGQLAPTLMTKTVEAVHNGHEELLVEQAPDGSRVYSWDDVLRWRYLDVAPEDDDAVPVGDVGSEE